MKNDTRPLMVTIQCFAYNHEPYIRQSLEGFVKQVTNFRFEAIVHDDASTDCTASIIKEYEEKYPEIIKPIYETENQYSKRDGSLYRIMDSHTRGKYVAVCEGDDYWTDPQKLQKQVDFLESNPEYSATAHQCQCIGARDGMFYKGVPETIYLNDIISKARIFHTASLLYRTDLYNTLPPMTMPYVSGDKLETLKLLSLGPIRFFNESMGIYRVHNTGMSSVVRLVDIKNDKNIATYMKTIYPQFPKYRFLSFLYSTFALYPKDVTWYQKTYYLLVSFILSFSYFPTNIREIASKVLRHYHFLNQ